MNIEQKYKIAPDYGNKSRNICKFLGQFKINPKALIQSQKKD